MSFLIYAFFHTVLFMPPTRHFHDLSPCSESCFTFVTVWEGPLDGFGDQRIKATDSVCLREQRCNYAPI